MEFGKILSDIATTMKKRRIRRRTAKRLQDYYHSPRVRLSRLYGYKMVDENTAEIIPEEAVVVKLVFQRMAEGQSLKDIKTEMDARNMRTRFGNKWTIQMIRSLVRPVFAGLVERRGRGFQMSSVYPAITSPATLQKAQAMLKQQMSESVEQSLATILLGSRS